MHSKNHMGINPKISEKYWNGNDQKKKKLSDNVEFLLDSFFDFFFVLFSDFPS